ncbi:MAG: trigger factor [Lachnospiraceae bacterium]|nr:trigger factor [Lachnospiraceae bacterium]
MSVQVEKLEHNMAKLTITVEAAKFNEAMKKAYNKEKKSFNIPGFRKGKVPMAMVEKVYGAGVFYEDAANDLMPGAYADAVKEIEEDVVSRPEIDVTQIGKDQDFIFTAEVALRPEVTLGDYKGLEAEKAVVEVTDDEVEAELKKAQEKNAREVTIEDRPVQNGDIITLNYAGTIDGVPFDGGTADNQSLEIGSHSFIDTFEDQLVGLSIGDEKDVEVTFPENYSAKELAGKPAVFHAKVLGIKEKQLPELDDDFVQDTTEFDTLDEYKADIKKNLTNDKEEKAKVDLENKLVELAVENAEMDIPQAMIDTEVDQMVQEFQQQIMYSGLSFDQYLQYTGQDREALEERMQPDAEKRIKNSLVLDAIAKAESIEAADEDLEEEFKKMGEQYQMDADQVKSMLPEEEKDNMKDNVRIQKAVDFLVANAKVTEASDETDFKAE